MSGVRDTLALWRRRLWVLRTLSGEARGWAIRRTLESSAARARRLSSLALGEGSRVVFVCHGNIMRSAYAAQVARLRYPQQSSLFVDGGTHAVPGRAAQDSALRVARELGAPLDGHVATPLPSLGLTGHDVVICMDALNEGNVLAAFPELAARVFRVGDVEHIPAMSSRRDGVSRQEMVAHLDREVRDPYGKGDAITRDAFARIFTLTMAWTDRLCSLDPTRS